MTKTVKEILDDNGLYAEDPENVFHAAAQIIELLAEYTRENEPYATRAISEYEEMGAKVYHMADELRDAGLLPELEI